VNNRTLAMPISILLSPIFFATIV